jgi:hypothetical protein
MNSDDYTRKLEMMSAQYESGAVLLREFCERHYRSVTPEKGKPLPILRMYSGYVNINEYGWLHIRIDALLPHCRYTTTFFLTDTITRLLDGFEQSGRTLRAMTLRRS